MPHDCSVFMYIDEIVGKKDPYKLPSQKDVYTKLVEDSDYDGALARVRGDINRVLENLYKNGNLRIVPSDNISISSTSECPEDRKYELEIIDTDTNAVQYSLTYYNGSLHDVYGNLPVDSIVSILRREGAWEGIPESVKELYRRLNARIKSENKKIAGWGKDGDEIRKNKELSIDQIKKIRELNNKIERSYRIIREDKNRIKELEEQYPGIEKIVK
jgi:hypothetical protein